MLINTFKGMVLPVRIELTTSPFITPALSCPPTAQRANRRSCAGPSLHHRVGRLGSPTAEPLRCRPSGLYTFPSPGAGLGSGLPSAVLDGFPEFERFNPGRFRPGRQTLPRECSTTELRQRTSQPRRPI